MDITERRASDVRIDQLVKDVDELKVSMKDNTEVTKSVHDLLASFRVMAAIAKWVTAIAAAVAAILAAVKGGAEFTGHGK